TDASPRAAEISRVDFGQGVPVRPRRQSSRSREYHRLSGAAMAVAAAADLVLDTALVKKYDGFGPRYTSYPTADRFHAGVRAEQYVNALHARNQERPAAPLSLYVHIPFCNTICYYCACNKVVTKDHGRSAKYIKYLGREIEIASNLIEGGPRVEQL